MTHDSITTESPPASSRDTAQHKALASESQLHASQSPVIGLVAGEVSGDLLGATMIRALKRLYPHAQFIGVGGPGMIKEGLISIAPMEQLSVMGIVDVLKQLPKLLRLRRFLTDFFLKQQPLLFVGIDIPDFNLGLERRLRAHHIPTVHCVSPSVWAWREGRLKTIKESVDLMLTLFPFEARYYERQHIPVAFMGHPLAEAIPLIPDQQAARAHFGVATEESVVAVLPGSRRGEIAYLGPVFIETIKRCLEKRPALKFIVPMINEKRAEQFNEQLTQAFGTDRSHLPLRVIVGESRTAMLASDAALLASGTATLEALLLKRPMVVAYKWSWLTHALIVPRVKINHMSLPNLLANQALVPEFLQKQCSAQQLAPALLNLLGTDPLDTQRKQTDLIQRFTAIHHTLKQPSEQRITEAIQADLLNKTSKKKLD